MNTSIDDWAALSSLDDESIVDWAEQQSWAQAMAECPQDPGWHAEGDVWTHTRMVCDELRKLDVWPQLSRIEQLQLLLTGIFHDAGKPSTTAFDEASGRIRSPNHARHGAQIARSVLMNLNCAFEIRESVCHLVLFHGRPPYLASKAMPEHEVVKLSCYLNNRLLYLFAMADTRGRIATDNNRNAEETIELWKLVCQETGCFENTFAWPNDHARFLFCRNESDNLHYTPHEHFKSTMYLMSGLPGAGKNHWLAKNKGELPVISLDNIRVEMGIEPTGNQGRVAQQAREDSRRHLRSGSEFALNATNITRMMRRKWIDLANDYNARVVIVYLEPNLKQLFLQNQNRETRVPQEVVEKLASKLEPPTNAECHEVLLG